jgi:hypothetical protein
MAFASAMNVWGDYETPGLLVVGRGGEACGLEHLPHVFIGDVVLLVSSHRVPLSDYLEEALGSIQGLYDAHFQFRPVALSYCWKSNTYLRS